MSSHGNIPRLLRMQATCTRSPWLGLPHPPHRARLPSIMFVWLSTSSVHTCCEALTCRCQSPDPCFVKLGGFDTVVKCCKPVTLSSSLLAGSQRWPLQAPEQAITAARWHGTRWPAAPLERGPTSSTRLHAGQYRPSVPVSKMSARRCLRLPLPRAEAGTLCRNGCGRGAERKAKSNRGTLASCGTEQAQLAAVIP